MHSVVVRWGSRGILGWNSGAFYMNDNVGDFKGSMQRFT